jgi:hypothetical protein
MFRGECWGWCRYRPGGPAPPWPGRRERHIEGAAFGGCTQLEPLGTECCPGMALIRSTRAHRRGPMADRTSVVTFGLRVGVARRRPKLITFTM